MTMASYMRVDLCGIMQYSWEKYTAIQCILTGNESSPVLYELLNLGLVHSEIPHHHSSVVAESQYHEPLLGVA